ncbi:3'-5' exonuclease [Vibrio sp. FNV 38]|nr:3'-5' exonuclease [Vibrio sp. FNV 38]
MKSLLRYFHPLEQIRRKRDAYLDAGHMPAIFMDNIAAKIPQLTDLVCDQEFIIFDFETTGLDSEEDLILSIGWVEMVNNKIDLATSKHLFINSDSQIKPETAVINHITPQMLSDGVSIHDAMMSFFEAAAGKIVVAHGCVVEQSFMERYLARQYHTPEFPLIWIDTLHLEKALAKAINQDSDIDLTLSSTRTRYGLPEYQTHNALADAVSTAELLLAIVKRIEPNNSLNFGHLYKLSN